MATPRAFYFLRLVCWNSHPSVPKFNCPIWNTGVDSQFFCKKGKSNDERSSAWKWTLQLPLNTCIFKIKTPCILTGKTWHFRFKFLTPAKQDSNSPFTGQGRQSNAQEFSGIEMLNLWIDRHIRNSLQWSIYHRRRTAVSLKTYFLYSFASNDF